MSTQVSNESDTNVIEKKEVKEPGKFNVIFLNDDYTPMEFVVQILMSVFHHSKDSSARIMMEVHEKGKGVAGTYSYEIAEQKSAETEAWARNKSYPLKTVIEPE